MTQRRFRGMCKLSGLLMAWVVLLGLGNLQAQTFTVTATQYSDLIQFVAQGEAKALQVEIFSIAGHKLFDSDMQQETTKLEWRMLDQKGRPVPNGVYLYAVTVKDASGKTSKQLGKVAVMRGQEPILSTPTVGEFNQVVPLNHNLNHCQILRSNGGRLFAQPLGCRLGLGTNDPQAKLDVITSANGTIAIQGTNNGNGTGVAGFASSSTGIGVLGHATATSGDTAGVYARTTSAGGAALKAENVSGDANANVILGCSGFFCSNIVFRVRNNGNVTADGSFTGGGADYADLLAVAGKTADYKPGDVLVIGPDGKLIKSTQPYSTALAGVYSTQPAFVGDAQGASEQSNAAADNRVPLALVGMVPVKVTTENGAIHPGDLLTTSSLPGYAMKATDPKIGAILGKALESWEQGTGIIMVLVTLR